MQVYALASERPEVSIIVRSLFLAVSPTFRRRRKSWKPEPAVNKSAAVFSDTL